MAIVPIQFFDGAVALSIAGLSRWEDAIIEPDGSYQIALTNTQPDPVNDVLFTDIPEIPRVNGYFNGLPEHSGNRFVFGHDMITVGKTSTLTGVSFSQQASGGSIGPFRWIVMYFTSTVPDRPLVCFWDHGSAVTILDGLTHTFFFSGSPNVGTILTGRSIG